MRHILPILTFYLLIAKSITGQSFQKDTVICLSISKSDSIIKIINYLDNKGNILESLIKEQNALVIDLMNQNESCESNNERINNSYLNVLNELNSKDLEIKSIKKKNKILIPIVFSQSVIIVGMISKEIFFK